MSRDKKGFFCAVLFGLCFLFCCLGYGVDISRLRIKHPSGSGELYNGGVYVYLDYTDADDDVLVENHIRMLAQLGMTHLMVLYPNAYITSDEVMQWVKKYRTYVSFQLPCPEYFLGQETQAQLETEAKSTADFVEQYWNDPEFLTVSVREEPTTTQAFFDALFDYYDLINYNFPYGDVPIYLDNPISAGLDMASQEAFKPVLTGTARYLNYWTYPDGPGGYCSTPRFALRYLQSIIKNQVSYIDLSCQMSSIILQGYTQIDSHTKSYLEATYGSTYYQRWLSLAQYNNGEGNQGLKEDGDSILSWTRHMPAPNCMSCMAWLSVATGYRTVSSYYCNPQYWSYGYGLMGPDKKGTDTLNEFAQTIREMQKFGWLINRMEYDVAEAYISYNDNPIYTIYSGSFTIPDYSGKIAILINADVADYSGTSPYFFNDNHVFRFDDYGNVKSSDYTPKTAARSIAITNEVSGTPTMYDLETGDSIGTASGSVNVMPGKGKFIFIGSQAELEEIRARCGITTITAHSGLVPNREEIAEHMQYIYPIDQKIVTDKYNFASLSLPANIYTRYRIHVTAKSSDGAKIGIIPGWYDGSWHYYSSGLSKDVSDGSTIWTKSLSSAGTTFVTQDFSMEPGTTQAKVLLYRSNNTGTLEIENLWFEDCSNHREITSDWMDSSKVHEVDINQQYQVYARVRNYPYENTPATFTIKVREYDNSDNYLGEYNLISNQALTEQPKVFQATFVKENAQSAKVRLQFVNSGGGTMILESACVGEILP